MARTPIDMMPSAPPSGPLPDRVATLADAVAVLARLPAATIHEAAGKSGALHPAVQSLAPGASLAGPAFTVRCPAYQTRSVLRAIDLAAPGDVLVVDAGEAATMWGGSSTIAAQHRGLAGVVTDGAIRDCAEVVASGLPVFARGRSLRGTHKDVAGEIGGAVTVGGQRIMPGDFVRGDDDGVTIVPHARIVEVAAAALIQRDREDALDAALRGGARLTDLLGL